MADRGPTFEDRVSARARVAPGGPVGVTETMIQRLVHAFYDRVRADPVLGPVFASQIAEWDPHLARMCDFWSSVMLMTGRFKGAPMVVHVGVPGLRSEHFETWLGLFRETAREVCPAGAAEVFISKAEMIGQSLQLGLAYSRGELPSMTAKAPAITNASR